MTISFMARYETIPLHFSHRMTISCYSGCVYRKVSAEESLYAGKELQFDTPVYYCGCNDTDLDDKQATCHVSEVHDACIDEVVQ